MIINVENYRGIANASIDVAPITLIAGPNHSGKTSILQATAAALSGKLLPIEGMSKSHAGLLVHAGTGQGNVSIATDKGSISVDYPVVERRTEGTPLEISEYAAGLKSILDEKVKDRADIVAKTLHTLPEKQDLTKELSSAKVAQAVIDKIWATIEANGWDAAHDHAIKSGAGLKGKWEQATGQKRYGAKIAESWLPSAWEPELQTITEHQLTDVLKQETEWLEVAISHQAVDSAEIARLETIIAEKPANTAAWSEVKKQIDALVKNEAETRKNGRLLPPAKQPDSYPCPHCKNLIAFDSGKVIIPTILSAEELISRQTVIDDMAGALRSITTEIQRLNTELGKHQSKLSEINIAERKLSELRNEKQTAGTEDHLGIEDCRARVERANNRLTAFKAKTTADSLHKGIQDNQTIIDILAPDGIRQTFLRSRLTEFNAILNEFCKIARYRTVELRQDMSVTMGSTAYMMLSESEQFRVAVALQVAFARYDKSSMVLIDGADILDAAGRNGLICALSWLSITAIIGMTIDAIEKVPNLSKVNGRAYWISNSVTEEITHE